MKKSEIKKLQKDKIRAQKREAKERERLEIAERKRQRGNSCSVRLITSNMLTHIKPITLSTMTDNVVSSMTKVTLVLVRSLVKPIPWVPNVPSRDVPVLMTNSTSIGNVSTIPTSKSPSKRTRSRRRRKRRRVRRRMTRY